MELIHIRVLVRILEPSSDLQLMDRQVGAPAAQRVGGASTNHQRLLPRPAGSLNGFVGQRMHVVSDLAANKW